MREKWYREHQLSVRRPQDPDGRSTSRFLFLGALGCVALFGCGVLVKDRRVGTIAAVLLMINPLYALHAHRAMSEVPYEAFLISALGPGLSAMQRIWSGRSRLGSLLLVVLAGARRRPVDPLQVQRTARADRHRLLGSTRADRSDVSHCHVSWPLARRGRGHCGRCRGSVRRPESRDDGQAPGNLSIVGAL